MRAGYHACDSNSDTHESSADQDGSRDVSCRRRSPTMTPSTIVRGTVLLVLAVAPNVSAAEVRGHVLAENKPLSGVTVAAFPFEASDAEARREALRQEEPKPLVSGITKADGTFALVMPATAGVVRLRVSGGEAVPIVLERVLDGSDGDDLGDVPVARARALAGRVVDSRGGPVVAATVTLRAGAGRGEEGVGAPVTTTTAA